MASSLIYPEQMLTYKDFVPLRRSKKLWDPLDELVNAANLWLRSQRTYEVNTCETFSISRMQRMDPSSELMSYTRIQDNSSEAAFHEVKFLRCLRIWLTPQTDEKEQIINYRTYSPVQNKDKECMLLDTVLNNMNENLRAYPIYGNDALCTCFYHLILVILILWINRAFAETTFSCLQGTHEC